MGASGLSLLTIEKLQRRYFWVLPVVSFGMGCASFVLVTRGEALARLAAFIALIGWPWILAEPFILDHLMGQKNPRLNRLVANFFTQSIQQEILFFSLPFLVAATHFEAKGQIAFTTVCAMAALTTAIDPFYDKYIYASRTVSLAFHALCCFVAALVILPLVVKLPTEESLLFALAFVGIWLVLVVPGIWSRLEGRKHKAIATFVMIAIPAGIWLFRAEIPAAGILVTGAVITTGIADREPVDDVALIAEADVAEGVYAFVYVKAPVGLSQWIVFNWRHGTYQESIPAEIIGGRAEGYRTYSLKRNFVSPSTGLWTVDVLTAQGQLLEHLEFLVNQSP